MNCSSRNILQEHPVTEMKFTTLQNHASNGLLFTCQEETTSTPGTELMN